MSPLSFLRQLWHRLLAALSSARHDDAFDEEVRSHLELATADYVRRGMSPDEARRLARVRFGSMAASKDAHRDARGLAWLETVIFDARMACRGLRRDAGFSATWVLTLAIALALNVVVATIREAMVVRGLPSAADSTRLAYLSLRRASDPACCPGPIRFADFEHWRSGAGSSIDLAFGPLRVPMTFRVDGRQIDVSVSQQTVNGFGILGVTPSRGRDFREGDGVAGAPAVAIASHEFWMTRLGGRGDVIGLSVMLNGVSTSIVGVLPARFAFVWPQDLYTPLSPLPMTEAAAFGRLKAGVTLDDVRVRLDTVTRSLETSDGVGRGAPQVQTYTQAYVSADAPRIYAALWVGAWFVLLVAGANLTNLVLVRTTGRWREMSTRLALGAGIGRLARQMLIESLVLSVVSAALAATLATYAVRTWAQVTASRFLVLDYGLTPGTFAYLAAVALLAAVTISLLPIARLRQFRVEESVKAQARGTSHGRRTTRLTGMLVGAQMALAMVLLLGAGLLVRSFGRVIGAETGVRDAAHIATSVVRLPSGRYQTPSQRIQVYDRLAARLRAAASTLAVSYASAAPSRGLNRRPIEVEGHVASPDAPETGMVVTAGEGYFSAMGRAEIVGRDFTAADDASSLPVIAVNAVFAQTYWPGQQPLGRRVRLWNADTEGPWRTVVGVVPDVLQGDPTRQRFMPVLYLPLRQQPPPRVHVFVRSTLPAAEVVPSLLEAIHATEPDATTDDVGSVADLFAFDRDWMDLEHADLGKNAAIAPAFAAVAITLSALGLVTVMAHAVSQRTKEIGVRMAVGADASDIARLVLREGMRPVAIGLMCGLALSIATNRVLETQLVALSPFDPTVMILGPILLLAVALGSCRLPVRRATRVDPVVALRQE